MKDTPHSTCSCRFCRSSCRLLELRTDPSTTKTSQRLRSLWGVAEPFADSTSVCSISHRRDGVDSGLGRKADRIQAWSGVVNMFGKRVAGKRDVEMRDVVMRVILEGMYDMCGLDANRKRRLTSWSAVERIKGC